jgi:hypothetical protein
MDQNLDQQRARINNVLNDYNVNHIYSTEYKHQVMGSVECSNRTITELLMGLPDDSPHSCGSKLAKSVIVYNNTINTQLGSLTA